MGKFVKSTTINGSYKELSVADGKFWDIESGEEINVAKELEQIYGQDGVFSLSVKMKKDNEIDPEGSDLVD